MPLRNPHSNEPTFQLDQPAMLPRLPFSATSDLGREALRLHKAAQLATERLSEVRNAQTEAIARFTAARQALQAEIVRGAEDGIDQEREHELSLAVSASERLANPETHQLRSRVAVQKQRAAVRELKTFLWTHVTDLLDAELRGEAERASADLIKARQSIAPAEERYRTVANNVRELLAITAAGEHAQELSTMLAVAQDPAPPLPTDQAIDAFERARNPEPVERDEAAA